LLLVVTDPPNTSRTLAAGMAGELMSVTYEVATVGGTGPEAVLMIPAWLI
jgi:hypothetical protein